METVGSRNSLDWDIVRFFKLFGLGIPLETAARFRDVIGRMNGLGEPNPPKVFLTRSPESVGLLCRVPDIPVASFCKHHLLPWVGYADISYTSNGLILGLSKFKRVVDYFAAGLTIQEEVTQKVQRYLSGILGISVLVEIKALHTCAIARGVKLEPNFRYITRYGNQQVLE